MGSDFEKMYYDLNALLQDICKFLSSDKLEKLSPTDQKLAESLINRSKRQLQEIAKIQPSLQPSEDYVIMNNPAPAKPDDDTHDIYSSVEDLQVTEKPPARNSAVIYPNDVKLFTDLPVKEASHNTKYGWIFMKRRFLLGFEKMKRVYATIHKNWLLVYLTEKDLKPLCTINLEYFEAKESDGEKCNFELMSTRQGDNKVFYFIALTHKDMLQWTTNINVCHDKIIRQYKIEEDDISIPESTYDIANEEEDDSDGIYEQLTVIKKPVVPEPLSRKSSTAESNGVVNSPANIKPFFRRGSQTKGPLNIPPPKVKPKVPERQSSLDSEASYQEVSTELTGKLSISDSTKSFEYEDDADSFSAGSADSIYETFSNVKQTISTVKTIDRATINDRYKTSDSDNPPSLPVKKKSC